jgi:hypothetical protein
MPQRDIRTQETIHEQDHNPEVAFDKCSDPKCIEESERLAKYSLAAQNLKEASENVVEVANKLVKNASVWDVINGTLGYTKELKEALARYDEAWSKQWDLMNPSARAMRDANERHTKSR